MAKLRCSSCLVCVVGEVQKDLMMAVVQCSFSLSSEAWNMM